MTLAAFAKRSTKPRQRPKKESRVKRALSWRWGSKKNLAEVYGLSAKEPIPERVAAVPTWDAGGGHDQRMHTAQSPLRRLRRVSIGMMVLRSKHRVRPEDLTPHSAMQRRLETMDQARREWLARR